MKRALITGATSGIGLALTKTLSQQGWLVTAIGRDPERLADVSALEGVTGVALDLTDREAVLAHASTKNDFDWIILNAGTCEYIDDPVNFNSALFERVMKANLLSMGYCLEAWLGRLNSGGTIALMGSSSSYVALPRAEAYGASKAAIEYLANSLRLRLENRGLHVALICPGFVETPLTDLNNFAMPMIVSADEAAARIIEGLQKHKREISFKRRFTYLLKVIGMLPRGFQQLLLKGMAHG